MLVRIGGLVMPVLSHDSANNEPLLHQKLASFEPVFKYYYILELRNACTNRRSCYATTTL